MNVKLIYMGDLFSREYERFVVRSVHQEIFSNFQKKSLYESNKRFIHSRCDTKETSSSLEVKEKSKIFSISLDNHVQSWNCCYWPRVSCLLAAWKIMLITTDDNWKSENQQPSLLLTCATTKRRHCMWAKIANKSLIMIDLRRTRLRNYEYDFFCISSL